MILEIKNREALRAFLGKARRENQDCHSIKGKPPKGATYSDGDPITGDVNVAWKNMSTGEIFQIEYEQ